jgi:hypothetical protein
MRSGLCIFRLSAMDYRSQLIMGVIRNAIVASGVLLGASWTVVEHVRERLDDMLATATLQTLDQPEVEQAIFQYLSDVVDTSFHSSAFEREVDKFYERLAQHELVEQGLNEWLYEMLKEPETVYEAYNVLAKAMAHDRERREKIERKKKIENNPVSLKRKIERMKQEWDRHEKLLKPLEMVPLGENIEETKYILYSKDFWGLEKPSFVSWTRWNFLEPAVSQHELFFHTNQNPINSSINSFTKQAKNLLVP